MTSTIDTVLDPQFTCELTIQPAMSIHNNAITGYIERKDLGSMTIFTFTSLNYANVIKKYYERNGYVITLRYDDQTESTPYAKYHEGIKISDNTKQE